MSDPQKKIKEWLAAKLEPHGAIALACAATGMSKDQLGRSKELKSDDPKKRRALKPHEIERLARHFNELPPGYEQMTTWITEAREQTRFERIMSDAAALTEAEKKRLAAFLLDLPVSDESRPQQDQGDDREPDK